MLSIELWLSCQAPWPLSVPLTLMAVLGRSKGKMISRTKLGFVAGKCVPVCPDMPIQDGSDFVCL